MGDRQELAELEELERLEQRASGQSPQAPSALEEKEKPLGLGYAPLDVALNLGTGLAAQAYGGLKGLGTLATGGTIEQAAQDVEGAQQDYTWQPRGRAGEAAAHALALPIEYATKGAKATLGGIGEVVWGDEGRNVGELVGGIGVPAAATLFGGRAALKAAPKMQQQAQAAFEQAKAQKAAEMQAAKYPESAMQAPMLDAAAKAKEYGIAINPYAVAPTKKHSAMEMAAGGADLDTTLSIANEGRWTNLARKDMGLAGDGAITIAELKAKRAELAKPYEELRKVPALSADSQLLSDISGISDVKGLTPQAAEFVKKQLPEFSREIASAAENGFSGFDIVELTKRFREDATNGFRAGTTESVALAKAKRAAADALDNFAERRLIELEAANPGAGYGNLVAELKAARREIAKTHAYQDALDLNTGKLTPTKIATNTSADHPYTGILADIGAIAGNFPHVAKVGAESSSITRPRLYRTGLGGTAGAAIGYLAGDPFLGAGLGAVAGFVGSGALRKRISSPKFQQSIQAQDYRPATERANFVGPMDGVRAVPPINAPEPTGPLPSLEGIVPPLVPGSFAQSISARLDEGLGRRPLPVLPDENPMLGYRDPIGGPPPVQPLPPLPPITRDLFSIADDLPKGTKTLYEGAVDFMLRQDALNQPAMAEATMQFVSKAEELQANIQNSQGFWRERYKAELDALSKEFAHGMLQFGVRKPQEAIGLQPLYEGSGPLYTGPTNTPRLQIEKTRSLRDLIQ